MKKMILLLTLSLTALMAIDFTMTKEGLFVESTSTIQPPTPGTVPGETNPYLEPVNLPKCDAGNPEVQFIRSTADWSKINYSSKRIFCVSPGDYTSLKNIKLTTSGTTANRRYIILNNGNDTHPGKLNKNQLANYALDFQATSYWFIERASSFDVGLSDSFKIGRNSTNNTFNRMYTQNVYHPMTVLDGAHNLTVQNSRFSGMTDAGIADDLAAINVAEWGDSIKNFRVENIKVVNNEFINVKGLRVNRFPAEHLPSGITQTAHFNGAIFDSNTVEWNSEKRTDCNGNLDVNGACIKGEAAAFSLKGGSDDSSRPIIITNNKVWGYRAADSTFQNLSSPGYAFLAYYGAENVHILNNIIFDGTSGIAISDRLDARQGTLNAQIINNIIVNCGQRAGARLEFSISANDAQGFTIENNLIKDSEGMWARVQGNRYDNIFRNNVAINKGADIRVMDNWEPIKGISPTNTNIEYKTSEEAGYTENYVFTTDRFTNNPRVITVENVVKPN